MLEKKETKVVKISRPQSQMRSDNVIREFLKKYWTEWNPEAMDICPVRTGHFMLFISLGYKLASFNLTGTRQEIYDNIVDNKALNAKIRKLKIHALLNPIADD